jgi:ABC-type uncharacterized transport system ATPase subunit
VSTIVCMRGITKTFPGIVANDSVDFRLESGEVHSLVGENGAGKTTLMRALYGMYTPDGGTIEIHGQPVKIRNTQHALDLGIGMVHQNFMQIPTMSILENIILGNPPVKHMGFIDYDAARRRISELLEKFEMNADPNTSISSLSVGERQKVEIIKALYRGANVLILDEPTAVLTPQESEELFAIIRDLTSEGKSVVFISHKLQEVMAISDTITVMRRGKVIDVLDARMTNERELAQKMVGKHDIPKISKGASEAGEPILRIEHLWAYDSDGVPFIRDLNFSLGSYEILGVGGVDGNGQKELAELIAGLLPPASGRILLNGEDIAGWSPRQRREAGIGHVPEDRMTTGSAPEASIEDNSIIGEEHLPKFSKSIFLNRRKVTAHAEQLIDKFDVRGASPERPAGTLSGGNLQKLVLAREISRRPKVLLASHPTRGVDIGASLFVHQRIIEERDRGAGVLLVTADLDELLALSDRIIIMYRGQIAGEVRDIHHATSEQLGLLMGGVKSAKTE